MQLETKVCVQSLGNPAWVKLHVLLSSEMWPCQWLDVKKIGCNGQVWVQEKLAVKVHIPDLSMRNIPRWQVLSDKSLYAKHIFKMQRQKKFVGS